ncbi:MAG TPA: VOC family protein [Burkholderiales bacterium]|nr:VOC family protein [Burkholderiales bacterium]
MKSVPSMEFSHMGMYVADLARMEDFYTRVLGFCVTDRGVLGATHLVFLSRDPRDHHQIVLASGRPEDAKFNTINQISFRMAGLSALKDMFELLRKESVSELAPVSHGNAVSVYFRDPEGNRIELFVDTPWYVQQPLRVPVDMALPERELWAWVEADARKRPGFRPVEEWRAELSTRMK